MKRKAMIRAKSRCFLGSRLRARPELATPQFMKYYVKGGPHSNGKPGYILSNANWDPYPMANQVEAFTLALAKLGVAVAQRIERFRNPFFTVIKAADVLSPGCARTFRLSTAICRPIYGRSWRRSRRR
jgi:hypothetical protein